MEDNTSVPVKTAIVSVFDAPVYHISETDSTMHDAQRYAAQGTPHGTFIYADRQTAGRGRLPGRQWLAASGENILGTLLLKQSFESGFPLKIGLAVSMLLDRYLPPEMQTAIKWPNDVLIGGRKAAGILCRTSRDYVLAGIGINILQQDFPPAIAEKAVSLATVIGNDRCPEIAVLIGQLLDCIHAAVSNPAWHAAVTKKLWKRNEPVQFMSGTSSPTLVEGLLQGIDSSGALVIRTGQKELLCYSGELVL